jgi:5'-nucleotidase
VDGPNPKSAAVAKEAIRLVRLLESQAKDGALLPPGVALNVNFPEKLDGAKWKLTRIGSYNGFRLGFAEDAANDPMAMRYGVTRANLPGIVTGANTKEARPDEQDNESIVVRKDIAISVMQVGYDHDVARENGLRTTQRG